ncbi:hypothetical protein DS884_03665 [Tenacibaculum sp. E3R01]|uniref:oxidoreductase n=1 Tax=Tenacibaculum sp. E3R01 TaxID=2267227 RepID=UPI000DEBB4D7|nr:hypothetical protein [Tenacibaculum sp. E3R01]RBW61417.1 hypothetical protein DS884_03665 [Tenacibaculum sp. E3R01]
MINKLNIKNIDISSQYHFAPINPGLAKNGLPSKELISFQKLRSNQYLGINYVGNISISSELTTNSNTLYIQEDMSEFKKLAKEISINNVIAGAQIACYKSKYTPIKSWKNKNKNEYIKTIQQEINSFTKNELKNIVKDFQDGILKLIDCGFKVIQIHAAHGYLLNTFISKTFNIRKDEYGTDPLLILKEIISGISSSLSDIILDIRISLFEDEIREDLNINEINFLNSLLEINQIDMLSISNGIYNFSKGLIYPKTTYNHSFMYPVLKKYIKENQKIHWNLSGNIWNIKNLEISYSNLSYSLGRSLIADTFFIEKHINNNLSLINKCNNSNLCHYYSRGKNQIECGVNKKLYDKQ